MLSILIPTYNYLCAGLVCDLHQQAERLGIDYEILVADDGSQESFKVKNRIINKLPHCKYIELEENIGRSRIRNLLGRTAQYDYLLFMDCDAEVVNRDFIAKYKPVLPYHGASVHTFRSFVQQFLLNAFRKNQHYPVL
ncbi:MAG: glycosyltransferase, partial [Paraprevotella sp.]|nr:glycosyltransferase [Paraprevotella sp.]